MGRKTLAWSVANGAAVSRLEDVAPELEKHLEEWIEQDPAIVDSDLLLIGRQQATEFGSYVDLLGLNAEGDLVVIELKRQKTLRETVAQSLEYAAWASRLSYDQVLDIAKAYHCGEEQFRRAFRERFEADVPDVLNETQRIILVAPEVSDGVRAVVEYLAENYSLPINAISFGMFNVGGQRVLVREAVLTEEETARAASSKKRSAPTIEQLINLAHENGVGEIAELLWALHPSFLAPQRYMHGWGFRLKAGKQYLSVFTAYPTSAVERHAVVVSLNAKNLATIFGRPVEECRSFIERLASKVGQPGARLWEGWDRIILRDMNQARAFVRELAGFTGMSLDGQVLAGKEGD